MSNRNGKPTVPGIRPEELRVVACSSCGSTWRRQVTAVQAVRHRIDPRIQGEAVSAWQFCCGCGRELNAEGGVVPLDAEGSCPREALAPAPIRKLDIMGGAQ